VRRTLVPGEDGGWSFAEPKTARSARTIPLPATADPRPTRAQESAKRPSGSWPARDYNNRDLVFATPNREPLDAHNLVSRHFKPIVKAAGLPESFRLYDLRHSLRHPATCQGEHPKG